MLTVVHIHRVPVSVVLGVALAKGESVDCLHSKCSVDCLYSICSNSKQQFSIVPVK